MRALLALLLLFALLATPALAHGLLVIDDQGARTRRAAPERIPTPTPPPPRVRPGPVELRDHRVHAVLKGPVADVTVEQVFFSRARRDLEGTYLFPLPEGATVAKFAMTMGGRMVEGEILEAKEARRIYHSIVRRRRDPGLLEYVGRGLFRARVFPIQPQKELTIRLSFQQILPDDGGTLEWRYPLATSRLHADPVQNAIVSVEIDSAVDLKGLYSPSHDVAIVRKGNRKAHVSYERAGRSQDKDFLLYVGRSPEDVGFTFVSHKGVAEKGTFLAVLAPSALARETQRQPKDVVFVLDVSGSMAENEKLQQAQKALKYGVYTLEPGDRFNVIAFSTQVRPFRDGLIEVNDATKGAATKWIGELKAAGGTNIEGALKAALQKGADDRLHMVVFLTDGRPTIGERQVDRLAKLAEAKGDQPIRVFTFGVGFDLDVQLLDRIAEATRATRDYVMPEEDLEVVASRFFRKVSHPVMTDLEIDLGSGVHDVYPSRLPDLFAGTQLVLLGRYDKAGDRAIRLKGKIGGTSVEMVYEATFANEARADYLARLWAHRKVAYLLDEVRLHGENRELVDSIVFLATRYGIVTPYTAGLVVEDGELEQNGPPPRPELARRFRGGGFAPMTPGAASGAGAARDSERLKKLKDAPMEVEAEEDDTFGLRDARKKVHAIAGKTFRFSKDGVWVDTAWDKKTQTVKIEAYSDAWLALIEKHGKKAAQLLSVGERVVFVLGGKAYEVVPPKS